MPRYINDIIIHYTATMEGMDIAASDIDRWHRERGWRRGIGYHYVVKLDGSVERGQPISVAGTHCKGHNAHSIGVVYVGGLDRRGRSADTRTPAQKRAMLQLLVKLTKMYRCRIHGHRDYSATLCPGFDATVEYAPLYKYATPPAETPTSKKP